MRKNNYAISPVISVVVVLMIVVSSMASILVWGVPYVQNMESESRKENANMQFASIADTINELASSTPGDRKTNPMDVYSGSLELKGYKDKDRSIMWYSIDPDHNFTITGLDPGNCFLAGTKVLMADYSHKNIEEIKTGDLVKSYDEKTGKITNGKVTKTFHHKPNEMGEYYITINDQLRVTPDHRFYSNSRWVYANSLTVGDSLFCSNKNMVYTVYSIKKVYEKKPCFDLQVESNHNYFVLIKKDGAEVLVHNENKGSSDPIFVTPNANEESGRWDRPTEARDDNIASYANYNPWHSYWSDELILYRSFDCNIPCSGFRINANNFGVSGSYMNVSLYDKNGNRIKGHTFSWNTWPNNKWFYYNYSSNIQIKKAIIKFYLPGQFFNANPARVYEFQFRVPIPECQILTATEVTEISAKLKGKVTKDQGADCYYCFEYGTTEAVLDYHTNSGGPNRFNDNFNKTIPTGTHTEPDKLVPAELYYFRARLNNQGVENYWYTEANLPFITKPYPPSNIITESTNTNISYSWTISSCGTGALVKTKVLAKTVGWPTGPEDGTADRWYENLTGSSDNETGLIPGQSYNVSIWSWGEENGMGRWSNRLNLTLYTKPDEIKDLKTVDSEYRIDLSWKKGSGADKTVIRRSTRGYPSTPISGIEIYNDTGTACFDTDIEPVENYYYSVWSYDSVSGYFSDIYKTDYIQRVHQLAVISPWTDDKWRAGTTHVITWVYGSSYIGSAVKIVLYRNIGTLDWMPVENITNDKINISDKSFIWWIPTTMPPGQYKINISEIHGDFYKESVAFYIKPLLDNIIDNVIIYQTIQESEQGKINLKEETIKGDTIKEESFNLEMIKGTTTRLDVYWLSNTDDISKGTYSLNGTICIFMYDFDPLPEGGKDVYFGNIWIFDSDSLTYESQSSNGIEKVIIEYGGILNSRQNYTSLKRKPTNIYEADGMLSVHAIQTVAYSLSSASGIRCSVLSNLQINSDIEGGDQKVYNFKIQFYGDNADIWLDYFVENFRFDTTLDSNTLYYIPSNPNAGVRFSFAHSFIELKIN